MKSHRSALAATGALALAATMLTAVGTTAAAAEGFNATLDGKNPNQVLENLPPTGSATLQVSDLPAGVGLYAFHCALPADPRSAPTRCDSADGTLIYIVAAGEPRASIVRPIVLNAEFLGSNPNPMAGDQGTTPIDCREQPCGVFTLGAGRDSTNPAYIRFFKTEFAATGERDADQMFIRVRNKPVGEAREPRIRFGNEVRFTLRMASGQTPSVRGDNCRVDLANKTIRALKTSGKCRVTITTPGSAEFAPFAAVQSFRLRP